MHEHVEHYSWNESVFQQLLIIQESGEYMGIDSYNFGTILNVDKKYETNGDPYIEIIFQVNE